MKRTLLAQTFSATMLAMSASSAWAVINCTVTATDISTSYVPTNASATVVAGSYTVNCTRLSTDPSSINYDLQANNGANPTGGSNNRIRLGTTSFFYNYELYRSSTISNANRWQLAPSRRFTGTVSFTGAALIASHGPIPFFVNIPAPQTEDPAGSYTDRVTMTLQEDGNGNRLLDGASGFNVDINTVRRCVFSTPATALNFTYTSFQTTAASPTAASTFQVRCTRQAPYTVALDATTDVLLGLQYNLTLSPTSATGNSANQSFTINGTIPAGQAGTCATNTCTGTQQRTLTISY
jgi:spore coat protein U-like protein